MKKTTYQLVKIMILQFLTRYGWESVEEHALTVFTEIILKYIKNIALQAKRLTEMTDRRDTNIFDCLHALRILDIRAIKVQDQMNESKKPIMTTNLLRDIYDLMQANQSNTFIEEQPVTLSNIDLSYIKKKKILEIASNFKKEDLALAKTKKEHFLNLKEIYVPTAEPVIKENTEIKIYDEAEIKKAKSKQKRKLEMAFCELNQTLETPNEHEKQSDNEVKKMLIYQPEGFIEVEGIPNQTNKAKNEINSTNPFNLQSKKLHSLKLDEISELQFL